MKSKKDIEKNLAAGEMADAYLVPDDFYTWAEPLPTYKPMYDAGSYESYEDAMSNLDDSPSDSVKCECGYESIGRMDKHAFWCDKAIKTGEKS